jgi:hypothetical protein
MAMAIVATEDSRVVEQPGIPDPGFEKFRIIFHDRIRGGARGIWNSGSIDLERNTLKNEVLHCTSCN